MVNFSVRCHEQRYCWNGAIEKITIIIIRAVFLIPVIRCKNIFPTKFEVHVSDDEEEDLVVFEQALIPTTTIQQTAPERGKGLSLQKKFRGTSFPLLLFSSGFSHHLGSPEYHSSTLSCPVCLPSLPHTFHISFTLSLSTLFSVFLSVSSLVLVHLTFFLACGFRPFYYMSVPLWPFLYHLLCNGCYVY